jgi:3-oxoacyl-[acyl-carrier protein] reductase
MNAERYNILVTGASRGIGRATYSALLEKGANVIGQSTNATDGLIAANFASETAATTLWQDVLKRLDNRVDILINNAGVFEANPIALDDDAWRENWQRTQQINLMASAELCRLAIRHWQSEGIKGRIINIASRAAYRGDSPDHWHYAASKAGMVAMTKTIARGYAKNGILAFAICPGFTMTGMAEEYLESRGGDKLLADIPLGRVASPEEIAAIACFCAFDAPESMTGTVIDANGASYVR